MIYDRASQGLVHDNDYSQHLIQFLYSNPIGRLLLGFISSKVYSRMSALYYHSKRSVPKIAEIEKLYHLDRSEYEGSHFRSFNDFFTRELKPETRPFSHKPTAFISPADAKVTYKDISDDLKIEVKGGRYTLGDLIDDTELAREYIGGACLIFRLSMGDCHHYIFPDDGIVKSTKIINGKLHTVRPIAHQKYKSYISNYRVVSELETKHFGNIIFIEIGALLVGKINNYRKPTFQKGEGKGYFELGGSTIIVLTEHNAIKIDDDIKTYSDKGTETQVNRGETVGGKYA
jgi:phosphatidylserine decarboxylase